MASAAGSAGDADAAAYWESRYADRVWSGKPNRTVVDIVSTLEPGRALDLGCGEGADTIWLAAQGWDATGIDISPSAIARARTAAQGAGVVARFEVADLSTVPSEIGGGGHAGYGGDVGYCGQGGDAGYGGYGGSYDLITASFFQSPVALDRIGALRSAATRLAPGGRLLIVSHAAPPSWAAHNHVGAHVFVTPEQEVAALAFDPAEWKTDIAELRTRDVVAPDGSPATLDDSVVLVRRSGAAPHSRS